MIDGASELQTLWAVILPVVQGAISAAMILVFLFSWKEFLLALVLTSTPNGMTVPIGIAGFVQEWRTEYGEMAAASLFAAVPAFVLATYAQRHIVRGLTLGAIKG
jgi:multiple sugar transport system permease protein